MNVMRRALLNFQNYFLIVTLNLLLKYAQKNEILILHKSSNFVPTYKKKTKFKASVYHQVDESGRVRQRGQKEMKVKKPDNTHSLVVFCPEDKLRRLLNDLLFLFYSATLPSFTLHHFATYTLLIPYQFSCCCYYYYHCCQYIILPFIIFLEIEQTVNVTLPFEVLSNLQQ